MEPPPFTIHGLAGSRSGTVRTVRTDPWAVPLGLTRRQAATDDPHRFKAGMAAVLLRVLTIRGPADTERHRKATTLTPNGDNPLLCAGINGLAQVTSAPRTEPSLDIEVQAAIR